MTSETPAPLIGIVDDDESVRAAIDSLIRSAGYRTALFASAEALLHSGQVHEMACLVVDIRMPRLNGLGLQRHLAEVNHAAAIIFVSAHSEELRATALNQGAVAVLGKPFSDEDLLSAIQSALEGSNPGTSFRS
jgi:FixJ family two-component response regulator